jgi:hypothetical protein
MSAAFSRIQSAFARDLIAPRSDRGLADADLRIQSTGVGGTEPASGVRRQARSGLPDRGAFQTTLPQHQAARFSGAISSAPA